MTANTPVFTGDSAYGERHFGVVARYHVRAALTANRVAPATAAKPPRDLAEPLIGSDPT